MTLEQYNASDIYRAVLIILAVCAAITVAISAYEKIKSLNKPKDERDARLMEILAKDKARLDNHETAIQRLEQKQQSMTEGLNAIGAGVQALLEHELHNGNAEQMEQASDNINKYLWRRGS